ncbi:MAG: hypothetical protein RL247_438 [Actinomycetota bacterium]
MDIRVENPPENTLIDPRRVAEKQEPRPYACGVLQTSHELSCPAAR